MKICIKYSVYIIFIVTILVNSNNLIFAEYSENNTDNTNEIDKSFEIPQSFIFPEADSKTNVLHDLVETYLKIPGMQGAYKKARQRDWVTPDVDDIFLEANVYLLFGYYSMYRASGKLNYLTSSIDIINMIHSKMADPVYGGFYLKISPDGSIMDDTKSTFFHMLLLYLMTRLYDSAPTNIMMNRIFDLYSLIQDQFWDKTYGAYYGGFKNDWTISDFNKAPADVSMMILINSQLYRNTGNHTYFNEAYKLTNLLFKFEATWDEGIAVMDEKIQYIGDARNWPEQYGISIWALSDFYLLNNNNTVETYITYLSTIMSKMRFEYNLLYETGTGFNGAGWATYPHRQLFPMIGWFQAGIALNQQYFVKEGYDQWKSFDNKFWDNSYNGSLSGKWANGKTEVWKTTYAQGVSFVGYASTSILNGEILIKDINNVVKLETIYTSNVTIISNLTVSENASSVLLQMANSPLFIFGVLILTITIVFIVIRRPKSNQNIPEVVSPEKARVFNQKLKEMFK